MRGKTLTHRVYFYLSCEIIVDYADFVNGIAFRFFQPNMETWPLTDDLSLDGEVVEEFHRLELLFGTELALEVSNTLLPGCRIAMLSRLLPILSVPKMSTFAIAAIINQAVREMDANCCFVNVGVWHGFTYFAGLLGNPNKRCVGVDDFSQFGGPRDEFHERLSLHKTENSSFFELDYQEYFLRFLQEPIGVYFYDGDHSYENQLDGLRLAEPFFTERCIVLVDDTNWKEPRRAVLNFMTMSAYEYKILLDRRTTYNCHPTFWNGIMVLQRTG